MKTVFNKTKVKSWIKKTHKRPRFVCGYGYITDGNGRSPCGSVD